MANQRRLLIRVAWNLLSFVAVILAVNWLSPRVPAWAIFSMVVLALAGHIWYLVRSDQKVTRIARQAALEHRVRNA